MRPFLGKHCLFAAAPLAVGLIAAGCSSAAPSSTSGAGASNQVSVTGEFGKQPSVTIPSAAPGSNLVVKTLVNGTGAVFSNTSYAWAESVVYTWNGSNHTQKEDDYTNGISSLSPSGLPPGLQTALIGKHVGSRILSVIPPKEGFGSSGGSLGISTSDTLVVVTDLLGSVPSNASATGTQTQAGAGLPTVSDTTGAQPVITIPKTSPPAAMTAKTLIQGTGPKVISGQYIVVQYTGEIWRNGKIVDSTWSRKEPLGLEIGQVGGVIPGMDLGLVGKTVGSRVLLVIPPNEGYGKKGDPSVGITPTDTLVFAVDILAAT